MRRLVFVLLVLLAGISNAIAQAAEKDEVIQIPQMQPKKWAICIGVSNYTSLGKLNYGAKDCISFADTLKKELNFSEDSVYVMADQAGYQTPNAANVRATLDLILSRSALDSGDLFIVYFSGHGIGLPSGDYWMPNDVSVSEAKEKGISISEILGRLSKKKLRNVVIISDACRAGEKNPFGRSLIELGKKTNIGILLGCSPGMKSYEAPSLGQGTFTYFLNRAIQKKSGIDPEIGAMLLSKLGEGVAKSVEDYTRHDYGENAQKPSIFAEKEQEVVLKAVPPQNGNLTEVLSLFKKRLATDSLSLPQYKDAMTFLAHFYRENNKDEEALQILRALQSYGNLDAKALYSYVLITTKLGKSYELNSVLQKNDLDIPDTLWDDLAVIHATVEAVGRPRFRKAIWALYDSEFREGLLPTFYRVIHKLNSPEELLLFANRLQKDFPTKPAVMNFGRLLVASQDGSKSDLADSFHTLESTPGSEEYIDSGLRILYYTYLEKHNFEKSFDAVKVAQAKYPDTTFWNMRSLLLGVLMKDPNLVDQAKAILAKTNQGSVVYSIVTVLGSRSLPLESEFRAAAGRMKGNLHAEAALWIVHSINNLKQFSVLPDELERLAKDRNRAYTLCYDGLNSLIDRTSGDQAINTDDVARARIVMADDMCSRFADIGSDPELVVTLAKLLNGTQESDRLAMLSILGPWSEFQKTLISNKADFSREVYVCLVNHGMTEISGTIYTQMEKQGMLEDRVVARRVLELVLNKDLTQAEKTLKQLNDLHPSGAEESLAAILKTHIAFLKGDKDAVKKFLESISINMPIDEGVLFYIEYLKYLSSEFQVPSERFATMLVQPNLQYHDLWTCAAKDVARRCYLNKSDGAKSVVSYIAFVAAEEPLNANFQDFGYNKKSDLAAYVGKYEFSGFFTVENDREAGWLALEVANDGKVSGTIKFKNLTEVVTVSGTINGFGRGILKLKIGGKVVSSAFALVPKNIYAAPDKNGLPRMPIILDSTNPFRIAFVVTGIKEK